MSPTTLPNVSNTDRLADQLRPELAALIEAIEEMRTRGGPLLTARYQAALGRLELQLLELQIEVRVVGRRIECLRARINRGEPVHESDIAEIDRGIEAELADWRKRLVDHEQALVAAGQFLSRVSFADIDEARRVKAAYRRLARWLHPDASPENKDLFEKYWPAVQDAYRRIDAALIEALQHLVEHALAGRAEQSSATDEGAELDRLRALVAAHGDRLARLKAEPPHCHAELLMDDAWVAAAKAKLEQAIAVESNRLACLVIRQTELLAQLGIAPCGAREGLA
jgi:hypothetical protein